jgi:hypothetical protein
MSAENDTFFLLQFAGTVDCSCESKQYSYTERKLGATCATVCRQTPCGKISGRDVTLVENLPSASLI